MAVDGYNGVIDISHFQKTPSVKSLGDAGIVCVVAKATQGRTLQDGTYLTKKKALKPNGIKWGSYHYVSGSDVTSQVENYLDHAQPEADELMAVDYEPSSSGPNMTYDQLVQYIDLIHMHAKRYPVVYGGTLLVDMLKSVPASVLATSVLLKCPLWYARYPKASITTPLGFPPLWSTWTLWQYSDGNAGPEPHNIAGFGVCDRDTYNGTKAELIKNWPLT